MLGRVTQRVPSERTLICMARYFNLKNPTPPGARPSVAGVGRQRERERDVGLYPRCDTNRTGEKNWIHVEETVVCISDGLF